MNTEYGPEHNDEMDHSETFGDIANRLSNNPVMRHLCSIIFLLMVLAIAVVYCHFVGPEILKLIS